jgi:hypothetical protein
MNYVWKRCDSLGNDRWNSTLCEVNIIFNKVYYYILIVIKYTFYILVITFQYNYYFLVSFHVLTKKFLVLLYQALSLWEIELSPYYPIVITF